MLLKLPDKDSPCKGGWLFDCEINEEKRNDPVITSRWNFRAAYEIDNPLGVEKRRIKIMSELELLASFVLRAALPGDI